MGATWADAADVPPTWGGWTLHPSEAVPMGNGQTAGFLRRETMETHDGRALTRWAAFAGGASIGTWGEKDTARRGLLSYAERASFAWHLALCEAGQGHHESCPLAPAAGLRNAAA